MFPNPYSNPVVPTTSTTVLDGNVILQAATPNPVLPYTPKNFILNLEQVVPDATPDATDPVVITNEVTDNIPLIDRCGYAVRADRLVEAIRCRRLHPCRIPSPCDNPLWFQCRACSDPQRIVVVCDLPQSTFIFSETA